MKSYFYMFLEEKEKISTIFPLSFIISFDVKYKITY
jgi:hypothetical protein